MPNRLDRDQTRRFCLKSTSLSDLINTVWRRHVIFDRGRRFLDMFKTPRPAHFHAFCSHDHSRSIKTNVRQSSTLFFIFILSNCESTKKTFEYMYTPAAIIYCRTRLMKMPKDLSGAYFVNTAISNH